MALSSLATRAGYVAVNDDRALTVTEPLPSWITRHGQCIRVRLGPTPKERISGQPISLRRKLYR